MLEVRQFLQSRIADSVGAEVQMAQLSQCCQVLQTRIGDVAGGDVQLMEMDMSADLLQAVVGDAGTLKFQCFEPGNYRQSLYARDCDPGVCEVEVLQIPELSQLR